MGSAHRASDAKHATRAGEGAPQGATSQAGAPRSPKSALVLNVGPKAMLFVMLVGAFVSSTAYSMLTSALPAIMGKVIVSAGPTVISIGKRRSCSRGGGASMTTSPSASLEIRRGER